MDRYVEGLRCQDVHAGLRAIDPNSAALVSLKHTRLVGMAADVASLIRGRDLIPDAGALEAVAVSELDVAPHAFDQVLQLLEEADFVQLTRDGRGQVTGLTETVPVYHNLYEELGRLWRERGPREFEEQVLAVVDRLARGPVPLEALADTVGITQAEAGRLIPLGRDSGLLRTVSTIDGGIVYSPFTGFEHPDVLEVLLTEHGPDRMLEEFDALKRHQGLAIDAARFPMIADAVARGLVPAPTVELPDASMQAFATLPYSLDRELLVGRKPVLDKALAVIACVRCAETFGGFSNASAGVHLINTLLKDGSLNPHSSSERQYRLMRNRGILFFAPDDRPGGSWVRPTLVETADNREALMIARDMLRIGEPMAAGRQLPEAKRDLLGLDAKYLQPLQTAARSRDQVRIPDREYGKFFEAIMGRGSL
ncbi:hypothetical protein [Catenulispora pinisilvae]|uniref:hypothetical protein n=1 Tax=Catenulispora pinisilvae TaxID=2705253 RepID=UPI00189264F8|nr:hypothetical protein [Catenulispora pinisilvae]